MIVELFLVVEQRKNRAMLPLFSIYLRPKGARQEFEKYHDAPHLLVGVFSIKYIIFLNESAGVTITLGQRARGGAVRRGGANFCFLKRINSSIITFGY